MSLQTEKPLSDAQLRQYNEEGFLIVKDFFTPEELEPLCKDVCGLVSDLADQLFDGGKITDKHENLPFETRLIALEREFKGASVLLHKRGELPDSFASLWSSNRLLCVVEQMLGTQDISGHPVWNLRTKTPSNEQATVPWHQDNGYLSADAESTLQPTAWIPLVNATRETGCMQMVRGGHKAGVCAKHTACAGNTWYISLDEAEIEKTLLVKVNEETVVTCEVPFGGVLFLNNLIPHRSLPNDSAITRWSIDLRWQQSGLPNGFFGLKSPIEMRRRGDALFQPDFSVWGKQDRHVAMTAGKEAMETHSEQHDDGDDDDAFSTVVSGPWMGRWEITHENAHTRQYLALVAKGAQSNWHKS